MCCKEARSLKVTARRVGGDLMCTLHHQKTGFVSVFNHQGGSSHLPRLSSLLRPAVGNHSVPLSPRGLGSGAKHPVLLTSGASVHLYIPNSKAC